MVKEKTTKTNVKHGRATGKLKTSHQNEKTEPKYRHYGYYQPSKSTNHIIRRHQTKKVATDQPIKRRTRAETLSRQRIIITVVVCLVVILGAITAKIFLGSKPTGKTNESQVSKVEQSKNIEKTPKSDIELNKEKTGQNLSAISNILSSSAFTADSVIKLDVPIYKQVYRQSCEAASLRMALAYRGIKTTDLDILKLMNYDNQPAEKVDGGWIWGDPHQTYVGDKDGDQTKMTGYGVFGEPIAKVSEKLSRPAAVQNDVKPEWLAKQIYAGNPVILWGVSIKIADAHWKTPDGKEITAPMRTHTRLVVGIKGSPSKPIGFYINDPDGTMKYWTTAQLVSNVNQGIGQAVAIY